jgi:hypothetical protein
MRSALLVVEAPRLDRRLRVRGRRELVDVQALALKPPVERIDEGIVHGFAGPNMGRAADRIGQSPGQNDSADENGTRQPPLGLDARRFHSPRDVPVARRRWRRHHEDGLPTPQAPPVGAKGGDEGGRERRVGALSAGGRGQRHRGHGPSPRQAARRCRRGRSRAHGSAGPDFLPDTRAISPPRTKRMACYPRRRSSEPLG